MYKNNNGELQEVTKEYKLLHTGESVEDKFHVPDHTIVMEKNFGMVTFMCPVDDTEVLVQLVDYKINNKSPRNWDGDLTDGKLSLKQSILFHKTGAHYYLRNNKFYPCSMCGYSQYDALGNEGGDGKEFNQGEQDETKKTK